MQTKITKIIKWILSSLDNHSKGSSGKKWTALALVICCVVLILSYAKNSHEHNDYSLLPTVLGVIFSFLTLLFGINVYDKKVNGNGEQETIKNQS